MSLRLLVTVALFAAAVAGPVQHVGGHHHLAAEDELVTEPVVHETNFGRLTKLAQDGCANLLACRQLASLLRIQDLQTPDAEELQKEVQAEREKLIAGAAAGGIVSIILWLGLAAGATYLYKLKVALPELEVEKAKAQFEGQDFKHHFCSCFEDMELCCYSCWCMGCRWADNVNALGLLSFWLALVLFIVLTQFAQITGLLGWIVMALVFTYYRQQMRTTLGMVNETEDKVKDFGMWCCCFFCATVQEARQIKEAALAQGVIGAAVSINESNESEQKV